MPSARAITRSSWRTFSNALSPRMMSRTIVAPSSGIRRRTAPSPSSAPRKPRLPLASLKALTSLRARGRAVGLPGVEQLLDDLGVARRVVGLVDRRPRPSRSRATRGCRRSAGRSRASSARGRCPRSAARAGRPSRGPEASCTVPSSRCRCATRRSAMEESAPAWFTSSYVDRRPRLARRRSGQGRQARARSAAAARSRSSTRTRGPWKARVYSDEEVAAYHEAMEGSHVEATGDPRRLPAQLRVRGSGDPRQVAGGADRRAQRRRAAEGASASSCTRARR